MQSSGNGFVYVRHKNLLIHQWFVKHELKTPIIGIENAPLPLHEQLGQA